MKVRVLIPFHSAVHDKDCVINDEIEVNEEQLASIRAVNVNMVEVIEEEKPKPKAKAKKK
jgi:hypothetical protein